MTLDDRSLREHLERRADAGSTDVDRLADVVMERVDAVSRGPWWRRAISGGSVRGLAYAAVGVAALVVSLAVLPPRIWGPGATDSPSTGSGGPVAGYPGDRPLTVEELATWLDSGPAAGEAVIADVVLGELLDDCDASSDPECPKFAITFPAPFRLPIPVTDPDGTAAAGSGVFAFRVRSGGAGLEMLGPVAEGSDRLAWTLPDYVTELLGPQVHRRWPFQAYLVEATATRMFPASCPELPVATESTFDVGCGSAAWLLPVGTEIPAGGITETRPDSLRIQNGGTDDSVAGEAQDGYFLVRPRDADWCFLCIAGQISQYLATVEPISLPSDDLPSTGYPADQALSADELGELLGSNPADRAGVVVIADLQLGMATWSCVTSADCPEFSIRAGDHELWVEDPDERVQPPDGPYAFRVRDEDTLVLLGSVARGPDGLAWTLPHLLDALPDDAAAGSRPRLYLVDAVRAVSTDALPCAAPDPEDDPRFACNIGMAWLVADEASVPRTLNNVTPDSLRVPNLTDVLDRTSAVLHERGFWLVDPLATNDGACFMCPPPGAAGLLGRVWTLEELAITPAESAGPTPQPTEPSAPDLAVSDITFSTTSMTLSGFETADVVVTLTFDGTAVERGQMDGSLTPLICLQKVGAFPDDYSHSTGIPRTLMRVDGTNEWVASFRMTAGDDGRWNVGCVVAYDAEGHELNANPALDGQSPNLDITGSHAPLLTMNFKPSPAEIGQPLEVYGEVTDEDTGDPYAGVVVTIGRDNVCAEGGGGETVTTNPNGAYTYQIDQADEFPVCTWITDLDGIFPGLYTPDPVAIYGMRFAHPTEP